MMHTQGNSTVPQLDPQTLKRLEDTINQRTTLMSVSASVRANAAGFDTLPATEASLDRPLHVGSDVVAVVRLSAPRAMLDATPTLLQAAALAAEDAWRAERGERTVLQFTERLEQAYEQAHLLFRLAKIPEHPTACRAALADAIDRLLGITQLGWVALRFVDGTPAVASLQGSKFIAGKPPIDAAEFDALLAEAMKDSSGSPIKRTDESPLAAATGAEVLLQPLSFDGKRLGVLAAGNNGGDDPGLSSFETQLFAACAGYLDTFHANVARVAQQEAMFLGTLRALTAAIDAKDPYTRGHSERVGLLAHDMALACGFDAQTAERYRVAGLIHDIGKIGVPERVLCKNGKLSEEEFAFIRRHPQIGFDILQNIPGLEDVRPGTLYHHERFDGTGYPEGLKGDAIPHLARVLALSDTFDAMSSNRSYRAKLPRAHVLEELIRCGGTQFDPHLAERFVQMSFARFDAALRAHADTFPAPAPLTSAA